MDSKHTLIKVLNEKNIKISDKKRNIREKIKEEDVLKQIEIISEFHKNMMDINNIYEIGLSSQIGKNIEEIKIWNKRARYISNDLDSYSKDIIDLAEECLKKALDSNYLNLIKRSMDNNEICIGKPFENNIWKDEFIMINDISKISFNLLENDCAKYIIRIKKRGYNYNFLDIIKYFISYNNLNEDSYEYIKAIVNYPYDSMKAIEKIYLKKALM